MSDAAVTFGSLDLMGDTFHVLADGFSPGSPEVVVESLARQLMDGEIVTHVRDSNRELSFRVMVTGADVLALNEAEALLVAEVHAARNTLTLKKPGASTPASVFATFRGALREVPDDLAELPRGSARVRRVYEITLPAAPHARAATKVSVSGLAQVSTTDAQVDAMDATTGWTATSPQGAVTLSADAATKYEGTASLKVTPAGVAVETLPDGRTRRTSTASVSKTFSSTAMSTTPYLSVVVDTMSWDSVTINAYANGLRLMEVASVQVDTRWRRITYYTDLAFTALRFDMVGVVVSAGSAPTVDLRLDDVRRQGFPPSGGTTYRQWVRTLPVRGSVRTPGSLQVSSATTALGDTLLYVGKNDRAGFWPGLRKWRTVGGGASGTGTPTSVDWTTVTATGTNTVFEVPVSTLKPGAYAVVARYGGQGGTWQFNVSAQTVIGGTAVGQGQQVAATGNTGSGNVLTHLGVLHLPPAAVPSVSAGVVRFQVWTTGSPSFAPGLDDIWLFPLDGALVMLPNLAQRRVFIDSPSIDQPLGAIFVGTAADRSDAFSAGPLLTAYQRPEVTPPSARVWFATAGATDSVLTLDYYPTAHTNSPE